MGKVKLRIEELVVVSFEVTPAEPDARGTVFARGTEATVCYGTEITVCRGVCDTYDLYGRSCWWSCEISCQISCDPEAQTCGC